MAITNNLKIFGNSSDIGSYDYSTIQGSTYPAIVQGSDIVSTEVNAALRNCSIGTYALYNILSKNISDETFTIGNNVAYDENLENGIKSAIDKYIKSQATGSLGANATGLENKNNAVVSLKVNLASSTARSMSFGSSTSTSFDIGVDGVLPVSKGGTGKTSLSALNVGYATSAGTANSATTCTTASKVAHKLTIGDVEFDGSQAITVGLPSLYMHCGEVGLLKGAIDTYSTALVVWYDGKANSNISDLRTYLANGKKLQWSFVTLGSNQELGVMPMYIQNSNDGIELIGHDGEAGPNKTYTAKTDWTIKHQQVL